MGWPPSRSPQVSDAELSDLSLSGSELPADLADLVLGAPPFPVVQRRSAETQTTTTVTRDVSCSARPGVSDSAAQVSVATRDAVVDAGPDRRLSIFGLLPGFCLRDVITATRQLGADVDTIVDRLLQTAVPPPSADQRRQFVDLVRLVVAVRRDHAADLVGAVFRIQTLRQTVPYSTAEEQQLNVWLRDAQQNAAAWRFDEDLLDVIQPPLWFRETVSLSNEPIEID